MSEVSDLLDKIPDISFIEDLTLEQLQQEMVEDYQNRYEELTGRKVTLARADPMRLLIFACSVQLYQDAVYIDRAGKQSFLKYSYGSFLDNLGALKGIKRQDAKSAAVTVRFRLQEARKSAVSIPAGTRVTSSYELYFETDEYAEIPAGELYIDVGCTCQETGEAGNMFLAGELTTLVDPIPYVQSVRNITDSSGGTDIENDESLAERIYLAPVNYSCAGPEDAYIYYVKSYNSKIEDVKATTPGECEVDIRILLSGGEIPGEDLIRSIEEYINRSSIKPMTDRVSVKAPDVEEYHIDMKYFINKSDYSSAHTIQMKVNEAIQSYIEWQGGKIGRDINPSKLSEFCMKAGAKRVEVTEPVFKEVTDTAVAKMITQSVTYGGIEND